MKKINTVDSTIVEMGGAEHVPLLDVVQDLVRQGDIDTAEKAVLDSSCRLSFGDAGDRGLLCHLKCLVEYKKGDFETSIEHGEEACDLLDEDGRRTLSAESRRIAAKSKLALGRLDEAVLDFEECLITFRKAGDIGSRLAVFNDLAHIYFIQGKWQLTREILERGLGEATEHGMKDLAYSFRMNLGTLSFTRGDVAAARRSFERCRTMLHDDEGVRSCRLLIMDANLALFTEDYGKARSVFSRALAAAKQSGFRREHALALEGLAEAAMEACSLNEAEMNLQAAYSIAESIAPAGDLTNEILRRLGDVLLRQGKVSDAKRVLERSLDVSKKLGDRLEEGAALVLIGEVWCRMGKREEAVSYFEQGDRKLSDLHEKWERARMLLRAAQALRRMFETDEIATECLAYLEQSADLFRDLELEQAVARVDLETAWLLYEIGEHGKAGVLALRAHDTFEKRDLPEHRAEARKLVETLEETLARRSLQRNGELISRDIFFTVTVDEEESSRRIRENLEILLERCSLDGGFLADIDCEEDPVFLVTSRIEETDAKRLLRHLITRGGTEDHSMLISLDAASDPRYRNVDEVSLRGVCSFLLWSSHRGRGVKRYLYLERTDDGSGYLTERDLFLIEAMIKDLILDRASGRGQPARNSSRHPPRIDLESDYQGIITCSHQLLGVLRTIEKVKESSIPVLLEGETGTGKELIANAIHERSSRRQRKFLAVNCAALPENLLESELFGHRRGAFTGAIRDKPGMFEAADGGTFFLDEIGDMGTGVQVKLLRFLEKGEFKRLGDIDVRRVDVRIVSATNKNLTEEVEEGRFRRDLFYRLNGIRIHIPPLRERREDIPPLVEWYLKKYVREEGKNVRGVKRGAMKRLVSFSWPGNVRELVNELRRAITLVEDGGWIGTSHLSEKLREGGCLRGEGGDDGQRSATGRGAGGDLATIVAAFERQRIVEALQASHGVKLQAARSLGLHEATLRGKIKKYRIGPVDWES